MENTQSYEAHLDKVALDIAIEHSIFQSFALENRDSLDFTEVSKNQIKSALRTAYLRGIKDADIFLR